MYSFLAYLLDMPPSFPPVLLWLFFFFLCLEGNSQSSHTLHNKIIFELQHLVARLVLPSTGQFFSALPSSLAVFFHFI